MAIFIGGPLFAVLTAHAKVSSIFVKELEEHQIQLYASAHMPLHLVKFDSEAGSKAWACLIVDIKEMKRWRQKKQKKGSSKFLGYQFLIDCAIACTRFPVHTVRW